MNQAFVALPGNGIFRSRQRECEGAVSPAHRRMCAVEKVGEHLAERVCGHKSGLFVPPAPASVIARPRNCLVSLRRALTSVISLPIQTAFRSWDNEGSSP